MLEPTKTTPTATGDVAQATRREWFGAWNPVEPLASAGQLVLWRVTGGGDSTALVRLYPRFQRRDDGRFQAAAERRIQLDDHPRILPVAGIGEGERAQLIFSDPIGEPLATRIEREPLTPEAAVRVFADVAAGLRKLVHGRTPPVDLSIADVYLTGDRGLLLGDAGLLGEVTRRGRRSRPTAADMTYSFAAVLRNALLGPTPGAVALEPPIQRFFEQALGDDRRQRFRTPEQAIEAFEAAVVRGDAPDAEVVALKGPRRAPVAEDEPRRTPAPKAEPGRRRSRRTALAIAAVAVVAAAAGVIAGLATSPSDPPPATTLASGGLRVDVPSGWTQAPARTAPVDAGDHALVARPADERSAGLVVSAAGGKLLESVPSHVDPTAVALRAGDAWRYSGARLDGQGAEVYLLPTAAGPVVAACYGPAGATALRAECEGAVATLRARGAEVLPLGGAPAVRERVADALGVLRRERLRGRDALASAASPTAQAAAADALAGAYASAVRDASGPEAVGVPGARTRLLTELAATGAAYTALAASARAGDETGYGAARDEVAAGERRVDGAVAELALTARD